MTHPANWYTGWSMILAGLVIGALLGLHFARDDFLGGYAAWPRRLLRLGHIALIALGLFNVVIGFAPLAASWQSQVAAAAWIVGGLTMPAVCFLSAWKKPLKTLFPIPVGALFLAIVLILAS